ncbi:MAG: hypothetical protein OER95_18970 [Acidimicrobiia bacterium]|nr:hypothetical protein [Acidimicrobiia bacterium]
MPEQVAEVNRRVVLDPTMIGTPVDQDAGVAGEWETSGILDLSTLFGEAPGSLFLFDVQAHGIADQDDFNANSRITEIGLRGSRRRSRRRTRRSASGLRS